MKKIVTIISALLITFASQAQKTRFNVEFTSDTVSVDKIFIQPLDFNVSHKAVPMRAKGGGYVGTVPASNIGMYNIVASKNYSQLILPVYVNEDGNVSLTVALDGKKMSIDNTPENRALSSLNSAIFDLDRRLWLEKMNVTGMKELVKSYKIAFDSVVALEKPCEQVAKYMKALAYTHAFNAYSLLPRTQKIDAKVLPFGRDELLPQPTEVFDDEYTSLFSTALHIIKEGLPHSKSLLDGLSSLYTYYNNGVLRLSVASLMMNEFISRYDYSRDFNGGLEVVKIATEKYSLPPLFYDEFMKRKSTVPGSPFPEGVQLVDANGKPVDFSSFKGKYVYIDMWASWCGPCCKEVPHLQKLESELKNENVVFLSISSDTDEQAWKNKMKELKMHGNQLMDKGGALCEALNIKAIPFFLIYDKEGNLHTYGALRPGSGNVLKSLLEGLK